MAYPTCSSASLARSGRPGSRPPPTGCTCSAEALRRLDVGSRSDVYWAGRLDAVQHRRGLASLRPGVRRLLRRSAEHARPPAGDAEDRGRSPWRCRATTSCPVRSPTTGSRRPPPRRAAPNSYAAATSPTFPPGSAPTSTRCSPPSACPARAAAAGDASPPGAGPSTGPARLACCSATVARSRSSVGMRGRRGRAGWSFSSTSAGRWRPTATPCSASRTPPGARRAGRWRSSRSAPG